GSLELRGLHSLPTRRSSDLEVAPSRPALDVGGVVDERLVVELEHLVRAVGEGRVGRGVGVGTVRPGPVGPARGPDVARGVGPPRSEEHMSELQSLAYLVCRL